MHTINQNSSYKLVEKKSQFIAECFYVESKDEAENIIDSIKKKYYDAKHHCYAYVIMQDSRTNIEKANDDGEPSKTAGAPILDVIKKQNLVNVLIVVTRYFGGTLLGTGGLVRAYSTSAIEAINNAGLKEINLKNLYLLQTEYNQTNNLLKNIIGNQNFNTLLFRFPGGLAGGKYAELKQNAANLLYQNGIGNVDWNALTNDAEGAKTKEKIMSNFYETIKNKTSIVLLMHDSSNKILTYETLPDIIKYFRDNGYEFQTIYQYLGRE